MNTQATNRRVHDLLRLSMVTSLACSFFIFSGTYAAPEPEPHVAAAPAHIERQLQYASDLYDAGEWRQAEQLYRAVLREQPHHHGAYESLVRLTAARELPAVSYAAKSAEARLIHSRFDVHQTDRFILFSDVAESLTMQNAKWVERAHEEFLRFAAQCGLQPLPLQHKLVCILFDRRSDYLDFAQAHDGLSNVTFTGYYSPRHDRVVFSVETERAPSMTRVVVDDRAEQDETQAHLLGFNADEPKPVEVGHQHDAACEPPVRNHEPVCAGAAKCVHEIIHQLMFHTRIMSPDVQYPLWVCEGLSTAFETDTPDEPFGPMHDYAPRREAFEAMLRNDELLPLRELVTLTDFTTRKSRLVRNVYQQSYALVTWICRERPAQLRDYLHTMRQQPSGRLSAARHLATFEAAFGNLVEVERDWLRYENNRLTGR